MKILENSAEKTIIRCDWNESLANAIRRSISEIPTLAIEDVEIFKNDSALYDEVLALRLGLVPLKTDKSMNDKTEIDFKLVKKGPGFVYSEDLEGKGEIIFPKIPLTYLGDSSKVELVATAKLGTGLDHAKYLPGIAFYGHVLEVKSAPDIDKIVEKSKGLIKVEKKGSKWICDLNGAEITEIEENHKDAITDTNELLFSVESFGQIHSMDILKQAISILGKNLDEFQKALK